MRLPTSRDMGSPKSQPPPPRECRPQPSTPDLLPNRSTAARAKRCPTTPPAIILSRGRRPGAQPPDLSRSRPKSHKRSPPPDLWLERCPCSHPNLRPRCISLGPLPRRPSSAAGSTPSRAPRRPGRRPPRAREGGPPLPTTTRALPDGDAWRRRRRGEQRRGGRGGGARVRPCRSPGSDADARVKYRSPDHYYLSQYEYL
jgi:hypothetical protein